MTFWNYDLNEIVQENHPLKKIKKVIKFESLAYLIKEGVPEIGRNGYGLEVGIKCLFLQFYYDLSDRQLEERLRYDIVLRWFCDFELKDQTPDHSFMHRIREKLGANKVGRVLKRINKEAKKIGHICNALNISTNEANFFLKSFSLS